MNKVLLNDAVCTELRDLEEAELCDRSGQTVGHFLSETLYRRLLYDWANAQISDEELQRRLQQPGGRTLAEIWDRVNNS